jgi:CBS domain containing-hemolysin-like protein
LALIAAFGLVTVLHIVLGELAPKSLALQRTERTALLTVAPLELFLRIFRPAIVALNGLGNRTLGLFGLEPGSGEGGVHSVEELQLLVASSRGAGLVSEKAQDIVERAFRLDDLTARQVMVPRVAIVGVPLHASLQRALDIAVESRHTRLPVYRDSIDDVVGVVSVMSLLAELSRASPRPLAEVAHPALLVPQAIRADVLLSRMRTRGRSLAVLIDEFGGTSGLVTASDLIDELVGPMLVKDEDNPERPGENV